MSHILHCILLKDYLRKYKSVAKKCLISAISFYYNIVYENIYIMFHKLGQVKFPDDGLVLGLSQFSILPQLPPKIMLNSKVVEIDPNIIISFCQSKSVTHSVV